MKNRNLSGVYVRVKRGGKIVKIDFSDLSESEMRSYLVDKDGEWAKDLAVELAKMLRNIGDRLDIYLEK